LFAPGFTEAHTNTARNLFIFNRPPTLEHLQILFNNTLYLTWLFNTLWVGGLVVAITLVLGVPAAYSLARLTGRWGERLSIGIFLTYLFRPPCCSSRSRAWWPCSACRTSCGRWC
jgi:ABC-type spermidine/putrescine transport system permease subunit I